MLYELLFSIKKVFEKEDNWQALILSMKFS